MTLILERCVPLKLLCRMGQNNFVADFVQRFKLSELNNLPQKVFIAWEPKRSITIMQTKGDEITFVDGVYCLPAPPFKVDLSFVEVEIIKPDRNFNNALFHDGRTEANRICIAGQRFKDVKATILVHQFSGCR